MALNARVHRRLKEAGASYELIPHHEAMTAAGAAIESHVPAREFAKVVVVRDETGADLMVVLPASTLVDRSTFTHVTGRHGVVLESERELTRLFPDCELGAMPPFGSLYDLPMIVDPCLARQEEVVFQAGNHHEAVRMRWPDYERAAQPFVMRGCLHAVREYAAG